MEVQQPKIITRNVTTACLREVLTVLSKRCADLERDIQIWENRTDATLTTGGMISLKENLENMRKEESKLKNYFSEIDKPEVKITETALK